MTAAGPDLAHQGAFTARVGGSAQVFVLRVAVVGQMASCDKRWPGVVQVMASFLEWQIVHT